MTCIDCGRQTTGYANYCTACGGSRFQNTDALDGLWDRFKPSPKPKRRTRRKSDEEGEKSGGFFSGWWPFKLLRFPFWLGWKAVKLLLSGLF